MDRHTVKDQHPLEQHTTTSNGDRPEAGPSSSREGSSATDAWTEQRRTTTGHHTLLGKPIPRSNRPRSAYYQGPPEKGSVFGTRPCGVIGRDGPRTIIRIERDYSGGELCQFHPTFPLELEGRVGPTVFSETINEINLRLIRAHDPLWAFFDNTLAILTLYLSPWLITPRYRREMKDMKAFIDNTNEGYLHPNGLHLRYPTDTAMLFLEMEYY